jgi:hypothetical protein
MLFEKVVEMGDFGKSQGVGDIGNIPFAVFEQDFGFL